MEVGKVHKLIVERESDLGYILRNSEEEVLVHYNDADNQKLEKDDLVKAFLFFDHKGRITATLQMPKITVFDCDWVEVVDVLDYGVFVNIGIRKDVLLSKDDLPLNKSLWPQKGDLVYAYLKNDRDKALLISLATREDFLDIKVNAPLDILGKKIAARVIKIGAAGVNVITEEGYLGFIHNSEYKEEPRLGQLVNGRVINVRDNFEINLSLIPQKEIAITDDAILILDYLNKNNQMPLCDKSTPEQIDALLGISKAAFKRAVGKLLKDNKITQDLEKGHIYLKK